MSGSFRWEMLWKNHLGKREHGNKSTSFYLNAKKTTFLLHVIRIYSTPCLTDVRTDLEPIATASLPDTPVGDITRSLIPTNTNQNTQDTLSDAAFIRFAQDILTRSLADRIPALITEQLPELIASELPQIIAAYSARMQTAPTTPSESKSTI
jgi:hypothetical protein